ncbi:MAG TPA: nitroreductase family deazaflavin-dependent oxidoreductase [Candidatus Binataceae bacterium]|nr:nitroreductase family deazaflavin-dependent oxidoreductase [Candidatus Binataceae bacterium]
MPEGSGKFAKETSIERIFNQSFGFLLRLGVGYAHNYLLITSGRKTGREYATPVNLLEMNGHRYLVASRGETGWVRNARAAGSVILKKGAKQWTWKVRELPIDDRPPVIKEFLERFAASVQRFYTIRAGSPVEAFAAVAPGNPVFELLAQ